MLESRVEQTKIERESVKPEDGMSSQHTLTKSWQRRGTKSCQRTGTCPGNVHTESPVNMQARSSVSVQKTQSKSEIVNETENIQSTFTQIQHVQA